LWIKRLAINRQLYYIFHYIYDEIRGDLPQKLAEYKIWTISRLVGEAR